MLRFLGALIGTLAVLIVGIPTAEAGIVRLHERDHQRAGDSRTGRARASGRRAVAARTTAALPRAASATSPSPATSSNGRSSMISGARRGVALSPQRASAWYTPSERCRGSAVPPSPSTPSRSTQRRRGLVDHASRVRLSQWPDVEADRDGVWARQGCISCAPHKARAHRITTPLRSRHAGPRRLSRSAAALPRVAVHGRCASFHEDSSDPSGVSATRQPARTVRSPRSAPGPT